MAETNEINNREHDQIAGVKRVAVLPATVQRIWDTSADPTTIYIGTAYAAASQSDNKAWLIEKVVTAAGSITVTHATDAWANRLTATYS